VNAFIHVGLCTGCLAPCWFMFEILFQMFKLEKVPVGLFCRYSGFHSRFAKWQRSHMRLQLIFVLLPAGPMTKLFAWEEEDSRGHLV